MGGEIPAKGEMWTVQKARRESEHKILTGEWGKCPSVLAQIATFLNCHVLRMSPLNPKPDNVTAPEPRTHECLTSSALQVLSDICAHPKELEGLMRWLREWEANDKRPGEN